MDNGQLTMDNCSICYANGSKYFCNLCTDISAKQPFSAVLIRALCAHIHCQLSIVNCQLFIIYRNDNYEFI